MRKSIYLLLFFIFVAAYNSTARAQDNTNLWATAKISTSYSYGGTAPTVQQVTAGDNSAWTYNLHTETTGQWNAQVWLQSDITTCASDTYDFSCTIKTDKPLKDGQKVTVKLYQKGNNDVYYFQDTESLDANNTLTISKTNLPGKNLTNLALLVDVGGNQANTTVTISGISFTKHTSGQGGDTSIPTSMKVFIKGESISGIDMISNKYDQGSLMVCVFDQNGKPMIGRPVKLAIVNSDSKATLVNTDVTSNTEQAAATAFQPNKWVGRTTLLATDTQSGLQTFSYITCFDPDKDIARTSVNSKVKSTNDDGNVGIITTTGSDKLWQGNHFTIDLGDNYDISLFQVMFEQGRFSDRYTIDVSRNGLDWTTAYTYTGKGKDVYTSDNFRVDAWNDNATFTQAQRYVRFTNLASSNGNESVTLKDFQIYGNFNSKSYELIPTVTASQNASTVDESTKTATATLKITGQDENESVETLTYIIRLPNGLEYHTTGTKGKEVQYTLTNLTPGSKFKVQVYASNGVNISEPQDIDLQIAALPSAPTITAELQSKTKNSAVISFTATSESQTNLTVFFTNQTDGLQPVNVSATSGVAGTYTASDLASGTPYIFTVSAYDGSLYSGTVSVNFTTEEDEGLVVTFTDASNKEHKEIHGTTGQLKELINKELGNNADGYTTVTSLSVVSGALNGADLATLRQMAHGNDYYIDGERTVNIQGAEQSKYTNPEGWVQGTLSTLDLSNATFKASTDVYTTRYEKANDNGTITYTPSKFKIENSGNDVPMNAFAACTALTSVVLPTGVVNAEVFNNCTSLQKVTVKDDGAVTIVGNSSFQNCDALTQVGKTANLIDLSSVTGQSLGERAFFKADALTKVKLSPDLTQIPDYVFDECANLTTVNFTDFTDDNSKLATIGYRAFGDSHKFVLGDANGIYKFPKSVEKIDNQAFANIEVTDVTFPANDKFTTISNGVFGWNGKSEGGGTMGLQKVTIPKNVTKIEDNAFSTCQELTGLATTIDPDAKIATIGGAAFANNYAMTDADLTRLLRDIKEVSGSTFLNCKSLTNIDLAQATTNGGIETVWGSGFNGCDKVTSIKLGDKIGEVHENAFSNCTSAETIDLGTATQLDNQAFCNDTKLKTLTVRTATAPTTPYVLFKIETGTGTQGNPTKTEVFNDPFGNIPANQVTVDFQGNANAYDADGNKGYMNYRKNNAFMRLLTKHLNEEDETYNVAGQKHADVILQRNFVTGYNTLALPFGSPANEDRPTQCAKIYSDALFRGGEAKSHISAYRGIRGTTFTFLYYTNVAEDPLDEFEPILVHMDQKDIDAAVEHSNITNVDYRLPLTKGKQYYLFENVDVNYDKDIDKLYDAASVPVCKRPTKDATTGNISYKLFDGNYNRDMEYFKNNTSEFVYTGTYKLIKVDDLSKSETLKAGDFMIQNSKFYELQAGNSYRVKGFRGWFTKNPNYTAPAKASIYNISDYNEGTGTATSIATIDANTGNVLPTADVFNLNGQCIRHNAATLEGLPGGIYIWNGKKIVVK